MKGGTCNQHRNGYKPLFGIGARASRGRNIDRTRAYNRRQNCWHIYIFNPLLRHCDRFLPPLSLSPQPPFPQPMLCRNCCDLEEQRSNIAWGKGVFFTVYCALKEVVFIWCTKEPRKDNASNMFPIADIILKWKGFVSFFGSLTCTCRPKFNWFKRIIAPLVYGYLEKKSFRKNWSYGYTISKWSVWPVNFKRARLKTTEDILVNCAILRRPSGN